VRSCASRPGCSGASTSLSHRDRRRFHTVWELGNEGIISALVKLSAQFAESSAQERRQLFQYLDDESNRSGRTLFADDPVTAVLFESRRHNARIIQKDAVDNEGEASMPAGV